jgi:hypothetical protein
MADSNSESLYLAQLEGGICQYRYHLYQGDVRINYDLATDRVNTNFNNFIKIKSRMDI